MCGRFSQLRTWSDLVRLYRITESAPAPNWPARFNVAPSLDVPVVRLRRSGARVLQPMRWGLVPGWAKDAAIGSRLINARVESLCEKPAFRQALRFRRGLLPADGFFEWAKRPGAGKRPYRVTWDEPPGEPPPAFAVLWERWRPADGAPPLLSCTVVTVPANDRVRPLHDRMPAILEAGAQEAWLATDDVGPEDARALLRPFDPERTIVYPVDAYVNAAVNEGPRCIAPLEEPGDLLACLHPPAGPSA